MPIMSDLQTGLAEHQTRKYLLERLQDENPHIMAAIEKFSSPQGRQGETATRALEEMIAAFDRVITAGDWESSLFLRNTVRPLKTMRAEAWRLREQLLGNVIRETASAPVLAPGMIKVYIAIFQHKANNIHDWETQLRALPQYVLGRPIYRDEAAAQQALRAKLVQTSDAYVCVGIAETAIQSGEFHPTQTDKQGNALLQLMPGAVRSENILEFVYQDQRYYFIDGKLITTTENR
jgi:intracellular multiplication protein IcmQ